MTREEILGLEAGEEIDNLVAEKVMGWHKGFCTLKLDDYTYTSDSESWLDADNRYMHGIGEYPENDEENFHLINWHPSSSILWAWEVVEKAEDKFFILQGLDDGWFCEIKIDGKVGLVSAQNDEILAICKAALLAVEAA